MGKKFCGEKSTLEFQIQVAEKIFFYEKLLKCFNDEKLNSK